MPNYNVIAVDLDGTLLDSHMNISPENVRAIRRLTAMGVQVVPASGRAISEIDPRIHANPDMRYMISSAGALVYDKVTGEKLASLISVDKTRDVLDVLADYDLTFCFHYDGSAYMNADHLPHRLQNYEMSRYMYDFLLETNIPTENFDAFCRDGKAAESLVVFFRDKADQAACKSRIDALGGVVTAASEPYNLEIYAEGANKGAALLRLAHRLGIDPAATMAVGDSLNDYAMIRDAGLGLVVANGWEQLKAIADRVICSNDQHIMEYILENIIE